VVERAIAAWAELDDAEAADLLLDVFARVFGRLANLKEPARFGPWLLIAARQRCRSRLARKRDAEAIAADLGAAPQIDLAPDPGPGGLDLGKILAGLPEGPEREAPRLFFIEGKLTARQIADRLRLSPETVTRHLERVRGRAKAQLAARLLERRAAAAAEGGASAPEHLDAKVWRNVIHGERFPGERGFRDAPLHPLRRLRTLPVGPAGRRRPGR